MEPIRVIRPDLVLVDWGPMTLSIRAWAEGRARPVMAARAGALALDLLAQLADFQRYMRLTARDLPRRGARPAVVRRAAEASAAVAEASGTRLTPMAAVAGAVADELVALLRGLGADKAVVNNGGDIALHLAHGRRLKVGLPLFPGGPQGHELSLRGGDGVGGVASSGWGGRSLSPGIAEQVTVWAESAALADAAATCLAGACTVDSPAVTRAPAKDLDPATDVPELLVTTGVGVLSRAEIERALEAGQTMARRIMERLPIVGAHFTLAGRKLLVTRETSPPLLSAGP